MPPNPNELQSATSIGAASPPGGTWNTRHSGVRLRQICRWWQPAFLQRERGDRRLDSAARPQRVAGEPLGAADRHTRRVGAEREVDRPRSRGIAQRRNGRVRIDVIHALGASSASTNASVMARAACSPDGSGAVMW